MKGFYCIFILFTVISLACTSQLAPVKQVIKPEIRAQPTQTAISAAEANQMMVVNSGGLNVRECAGTDCKAVGLLQDGDIVTLTGETEVPSFYTWHEISLPVSGWVSGRYLVEVK